MKSDTAKALQPSWNALLLVCKDCGKRSSGPGKALKVKEVVHELRSASRDARPRPRVLLTNCMGLCPKKAVAVASADGTTPPRAVAVGSVSALHDALPLLRGSAPSSAG